MKTVVIALVLTVSGACTVVAGQVQQAQRPIRTVRDLDDFLSKPLADRPEFVGGKKTPTTGDLRGCQGELQRSAENVSQWEKWYENNRIESLGKENIRLRSENQRLQNQVLENELAEVIGVGVIAGIVALTIYGLWRAMRSIRRLFPLSKTRKQLGTLLAMAAWVSVSTVIALAEDGLLHHPINLLSVVFVYSLPALAFGSIGVWWFGRTKPEVLW